MRLSLRLPAEADAAAFGRALAPRLGAGDAVLLSGPVGAGKSVIARAVVRARLGEPDAEVPSPTFTLVQAYAAEPPVWHADLYRLEGPDEVPELGLPEAFAAAIVLVEWPDRLGPWAPPGALRLDLAPEGAARRLEVSGPPEWAPRLAGLLGGAAA